MAQRPLSVPRTGLLAIMTTAERVARLTRRRMEERFPNTAGVDTARDDIPPTGRIYPRVEERGRRWRERAGGGDALLAGETEDLHPPLILHSNMTAIDWPKKFSDIYFPGALGLGPCGGKIPESA